MSRCNGLSVICLHTVMRRWKTFLCAHTAWICGVMMSFLMLMGFANSSEAQPSTKSETKTPSVLSQQAGEGVITGDGFQMDLDKKVVTYFGNVKVVQGESTLFCDKLDAFYEEFGKWKRIVTTGNVRLVDSAFTATGEEGIFYPDEQKIEINTHAKVWQDNNTITANQIIAYIAQDVVEGYGNETTERVIMTVYSGERMSLPGQTPTPRENTPTEEESAAPIVIISDTLQFENLKQLATFTGNVVATQDKDEIKADKMLVYLTKTEQGQNDVERLELYSNVNITHEQYLILGDSGVYHKVEQYAVVTGTEQQFARIVDTTDNVTRIQAYGLRYNLANNLVESIPLEGSRVETKFETEQGGSLLTPEKPALTPTPEITPQVNREKMPSATVYPGKKK